MSQTEYDPIDDIIENYRQNEKTLVKQLYFALRHHGTTIGGFREDIWREMFEQIIPKKFVIAQSVFIMDSQGQVSREVDLAIFDETYTPYIFRYGRIKFIPIEAVAVVVECKSSSLDQENLETWAKSIAVLTTSLDSYTRVATKIIVGKEEPHPTQTQTRPLRILCCLNEEAVNTKMEDGEPLFDVIIRAPSEGQGLEIAYDERKENLQDWYLALNHAGGWQSTDANMKGSSELKEIKLTAYQVKEEDKPVSLLSLNLQLNQLLMLINNPIPFPHKAYAEMFNEHSKGGKANE